MNLYGCRIGVDKRIGAFVEIQKGVEVGARCKISSHSFVCEGVTIEDESSLTLTTYDPDGFYIKLNELVLEHNIDIEVVTLADENMDSLYHYLSGREHH